MFARRNLPPGRDAGERRGGSGTRAALALPVAAQAGKARGPAAGNAAQRIAAVIPEYAGRARGEVRRRAPGKRRAHRGAGGADRRNLPGERHGQRATDDPGGAGAVRGRSADLLLLDGRLVLRHHDGIEPEERIPAAEPVPARRTGLLRDLVGTAARRRENQEPANPAAAEPHRAPARNAGGIERDGTPRRGRRYAR